MNQLTQRDFLKVCRTLIISLGLVACGVGPTPSTALVRNDTPVSTSATLPSMATAPTSTSVPTSTATMSYTPTTVSTDAPIASIKVMSYNILYGGGVDPEWRDKAPQGFPGSSGERFRENRLPQIIAIIKQMNPDILGIQEAADWDKGTPSVAAQVASELGMNYALGISKGRLHVVLYTKFKILETEDFSDRISEQGRALRTLVSTPLGNMNVFVLHFAAHNDGIRREELNFFVKEYSSYLESPSILMGDLNFEDDSRYGEPELLKQTGWQFVTRIASLDQIWVSPSLSTSIRELPTPPPESLWNLSDHFPVIAAIDIYP